MVAAEPGIQYAALHYKSLEIERNKELVKNHGQFDAVMERSKKSVGCIHWWVNNVSGQYLLAYQSRKLKQIVHYQDMVD